MGAPPVAATFLSSHAPVPPDPGPPAAVKYASHRPSGEKTGSIRSSFLDPLELEPQIVRGLKTVVGILRQARANDPGESGRRPGLKLAHGRRFPLEDRADQTHLRFALERSATHDGFIEQTTESPD